jgi:hypothetical protein
MKRALFSLFSLVILSIVFTACPPLEEDDYVFEEATITYDGVLDYQKWIDILDDVGRQNKYVRLDLKDCTYIDDNETGGLIKVWLYEHLPPDGIPDEAETVGLKAGPYIAFDPIPAIGWGKDKIVAIVLPDEAKMINQATDREVIKEKEADKKRSAFANFTNLRSVSAANLSIIGNYAFIDNKTLIELDFPSVGHKVDSDELKDSENLMENGFRVDIGHYAFKGCTSLKEAAFNSAAVIGKHAFEGCTSLAKVSFPNVWMIGENAFEGCTSLTDVRFESATKIGSEAFMDSTALKKAYFPADPERFTSGDPFSDIPTDYFCNYDSMIFFSSAFSGCTALEVLEVRNAWNVYFYEGVLENIGTSLEIHLFDDDGTKSYGHPQEKLFLGNDEDDTITLREVKLFVPGDAGNVKIGAPGSIAEFIESKYSSISVTFSKL